MREFVVGAAVRHMLGPLVVTVGVLTACAGDPEVVTSIAFDGERYSISTSNVSCTRQPDGSVVILIVDGHRRTVRMHIAQYGRISVLKVGLRYEDLRGFVADPDEMTGTKVDDTFDVRGRMPPEDGERDWHTFAIETTCPRYRNAGPADTVPALGSP